MPVTVSFEGVVGIIPSIVKKEHCQPNFNAHLGFLEDPFVTSKSLGQSIFDGTFAAADIVMSNPLIILKEVGVLGQKTYTALWEHTERLRGKEIKRK